MRICLFGSAFDPVHLGHERMAISMLQRNYCDQLWFIPVRHHPFGKVVADTQHRLWMLENVIARQDEHIRQRLRVEKYELQQSHQNYSIETLQALSDQHPGHRFSWLIGSDNLQHFHRWKDYQELLDTFQVFVYPREGYGMEPWYDGMVVVRDVEEINVSSTQVRTLIAGNHDIAGLVHPDIAEYISEQRLYIDCSM